MFLMITPPPITPQQEDPHSDTFAPQTPSRSNIMRIAVLASGGAVLLLAIIAMGIYYYQSSRNDADGTPGKTWGNKPGKTQQGATPTVDGDITTIAIDALPAAPTIVQPTRTSYPMYFYLFTHTEDHINHALSEERYMRIGPMLQSLQAKYPSEDITWTIEFQGADAETVAARNATTGVATYLKSLASEGLVEFGYHAHHDPTYLNRPQKSLTASSTWDETYDAVYQWITCKKDPLKGGCIATTGGGATAIQNNFGPVKIVTGVSGTSNQGALIERSAGSEAVRAVVPNRILGFGLPDHGATLKDQSYAGNRDALLALLTPTAETTSTVFWMDNSIRMNDGIPHEGLSSLGLSDGRAATQTDLTSISNTRVNIINTSIADKYLYTAERQQSPTQYAYSHQSDPELPANMLKSEADRNAGYTQTQESLEYILGTYLASHDGGFLSSDAVVNAVTTDDFWNVDETELAAIAASLVQNWKTTPPVYTTDGTDFYSLADTFALLWNGLNGKFNDRSLVSSWYGPWALSTSDSAAATIASSDLLSFISAETTDRAIPASFTIDGSTYSAAQMLYAMAYEYLLQADETLSGKWTGISIPALSPLPESFDYLEAIGCTGCTDTAWSLKPARFHE